MSAMAAYGSGIDVAAEEVATVGQKLRPIGLACTSAHGYWSFPKELAAFKKGLGYPVNTVTALQRIEGLSVGEARDKVKKLVVRYEQEALALADGLIDPESTLPEHMRRYVQGVFWAVWGANYWSATCLRYNSYEQCSRRREGGWMASAGNMVSRPDELPMSSTKMHVEQLEPHRPRACVLTNPPTTDDGIGAGPEEVY
jgi:hypothetical protein